MAIKAEADKAAAASGGSVKIVRSYEEAVKGADFINVYSWVSPEVFAKGLETHFKGDPEFVETKKKLAKEWCVSKRTLSMAPKDCKVMHCLPVSRNNEVTDEVLNSPAEHHLRRGGEPAAHREGPPRPAHGRVPVEHGRAAGARKGGLMAGKVRIVHYINQFFAGIGGEEKGSSPLEHCEGPKGPGVGMMQQVGSEAEIVRTIWCGDNLVNQETERILRGHRRPHPRGEARRRRRRPRVQRGALRPRLRAWLRASATQTLKVPVLIGLFPENPAVEIYRKDAYI